MWYDHSHGRKNLCRALAGAHSVKTGMEFRQYRETDWFFANSQTGQFNFDWRRMLYSPDTLATLGATRPTACAVQVRRYGAP